MTRCSARVSLPQLCLVFLAACCQRGQHPAERCSDATAYGTYEVVTHNCENPSGDTDYCPFTRYIAIGPGAAFGTTQDRKAAVVWFSDRPESTDYAYEVLPIRGTCSNPNKYLLYDYPETSAWLTLDHGTVREYVFEGFTTKERDKLHLRMHMPLRRVVRNPELDRLLRIDPKETR